jgi:hypothetical protein
VRPFALPGFPSVPNIAALVAPARSRKTNATRPRDVLTIGCKGPKPSIVLDPSQRPGR